MPGFTFSSLGYFDLISQAFQVVLMILAAICLLISKTQHTIYSFLDGGTSPNRMSNSRRTLTCSSTQSPMGLLLSCAVLLQMAQWYSGTASSHSISSCMPLTEINCFCLRANSCISCCCRSRARRERSSFSFSSL